MHLHRHLISCDIEYARLQSHVHSFIIILAVVAIDFWKAWKAQKNLEAEQMQAILNTPLETFSELEEGQTLDELAKKYADDNAAKTQQSEGN